MKLRTIWSFLLVGIVALSIVLGTACAPVAAARVQQATPTNSPQARNQPGLGQAAATLFIAYAAIGATADITGLTPKDVHAELLTGKSLAQITESHGKSSGDVVQSVVDKARQRLDSAVAAGELTREKADTALSRITDRVNHMVHNPQLGQRLQGAEDRIVRLALLRATAKVVELPVQTVRQRITGGESPAQIATSAGHTADEVVQEAVTAAKTRFTRVVEAGRLTQEEADVLLEIFQARASELVNK